MCSLAFPTKKALVEHSLITQHGINRCCRPCFRIFASEQSLEQHKSTCKSIGPKELSSDESAVLLCRGNPYSTIPSKKRANLFEMLEWMVHSKTVLQYHGFSLGDAQQVMTDFLTTPKRQISEPRCKAVVLDCEMSGTAEGESELVFVTAIDFFTGKTLVDSIVSPSRPIVDWRSNFHGITAGKMAVAKAQKQALEGFEAARAELWKHVDEDTIVIGQSVNNDLESLRTIHHRIVDTAVLASEACFGGGAKPKYWGLGLKDLCNDLLGMKIREAGPSGSSNHDSLEDVLACREVLLYMLEHHEEFLTWAGRKRQLCRKSFFGNKKTKGRRSNASHSRTQAIHDDDDDFKEPLQFRDVIDYDMWPEGMSDFSD